MKPLNVPLVQQAEGSVDCGIASATMIAKYWGLDLAFADIQKKLKVDKYGIYCPQLALFLLKEGFNVSIVTFNPAIFISKNTGMGGKELKKHFEKLLTIKLTGVESPPKRTIRFFLKLLEAGGKIEVRIPTEGDIRKEIKSGNPPVVSATTRFLTAKEPRLNYHFNVVTGMDKDHIYVNDPAWGERGGRHKHKISDFVFGMYASVAGGVDNPSLIRIHRK